LPDNFESFGLRFVTENSKSAIADIQGFNKAVSDGDKGIEKFAKSSEKGAKTSGSLGDKFKDLAKNFKIVDGAIGNLVKSLGSMTGIGSQVTGMLGGMTGALGAATIATGGLAAGVAAFVFLATRSAGLRGIIEGFDELAQQTGQDTDIFLGNLKRAAAGTVSETSLMIQANTALAGTTGLVAEEIGKKLPQILEIARYNRLFLEA